MVEDDMTLEAHDEIKYLLHFMTGKLIIDCFEENRFLRYMLDLY